MSVTLILGCLVGYFLLLYLISWFTSKNSGNDTYFTGNRNSPWYLVAFGMIGASLSGVTFLSVPGMVQKNEFAYFQMVLGYIPGYLIIAFVLMPLYYRMKLTTIYTWLNTRFGLVSYQTGAYIFLISRLFGSALRMYLTAAVLQAVLFETLGVPFWLTVVGSIGLIWFYTHKGGIKTIVYTDTLQTVFMLLAVIGSLYYLGLELNAGLGGVLRQVTLDYQIFFFDDVKSELFFGKQFLGGLLIALVMTGLDQDMMQKNLTCKNIKDAQKNMVSFALILLPVNLMFLVLGAFLYQLLAQHPEWQQLAPDELFGFIATSGTLPLVVGVCFVLGLTAAAYSSADSALTSLTTSFCIDILGIEKKELGRQITIRKKVHLGVSIISILIILIAREFHNQSLITLVFKVASYTYGPLLGLFAFGILSKRKIQDKWSPFLAVLAPLLSFWIAEEVNTHYGYVVGNEVLLLNGGIVFIGLYISGYCRKQTEGGIAE